jgi:hypothetical protein
MRARIQNLASIIVLMVAWASGAFHPLFKYLSLRLAAATLLSCLCLVGLSLKYLATWISERRTIGIGLVACLLCILSMAIIALHPFTTRHSINTGSDREEALTLELDAVQRHQYPYDARTYLGNPPTPLPGAMLLAAPFFALGHVGWQNILWLGLFFWFCLDFFLNRASAILFIILFLLLSPSYLADLVSGGDYIANFFYVACATGLFVQCLDGGACALLGSGALLGIALSSRIIYVDLLIPIFAIALQRTTAGRAIFSMGVVVTVAACITLPVFAPHPITRLMAQLYQNSTKLQYLPHSLHATWVLPALAALVSVTAFWVRMDVPRLYLIFGLASFVMLFPSVATFAPHADYAFIYLAVSCLSLGLWTFSSYERRNLPPVVQPISLKR